MHTYNEANQIRLILKMKLYSYRWYANSEVRPDKEGYRIVILVKEINTKVKRYIPKKINEVNIDLELV